MRRSGCCWKIPLIKTLRPTEQTRRAKPWLRLDGLLPDTLAQLVTHKPTH